MTKMSRAARTRLWLDRLNRQVTSGLTVAQFCQRENISPPSFYQWRRRLTPRVESPANQRTHKRPQRPKRKPVDGFAELIVQPATSMAQATLPGGIVVSLGSQPDIAAVIVDRLLRHVSRTEEELRC